jgi:hypothetical protein
VNAALARVSAGRQFNRFGMTRELSVGAVAAVGAFLLVHSADLGDPAALVRDLNPPSQQKFLARVNNATRCLTGGLAWGIGLVADVPAACRERPDGNVSSADIALAEVRAERCFQTEDYAVGDRGLYSVTAPPRDGISLPEYLAQSDKVARRVRDASAAGRDAALLDYYIHRVSYAWLIHRFFGDPGLRVAAERYAGPEHQAAVALLRERLADAGFAPSLSPVQRAELELLAAAPLDFVPCVARRGPNKV